MDNFDEVIKLYFRGSEIQCSDPRLNEASAANEGIKSKTDFRDLIVSLVSLLKRHHVERYNFITFFSCLIFTFSLIRRCRAFKEH